MPRILSIKTCSKNALSPSCIDLFKTNSPLSFQNTIAISNRLSNFHKMVITVMKHFPIERNYRNWKYFDQTKFKNNLIEKFVEGISNYESFETAFIEVLNNHASLRKKFFRANHVPYILKNLEEELLCLNLNLWQVTSILKFKPTINYSKSKNFCSRLYKTERRKYWVIKHEKSFRQYRNLENDETFCLIKTQSSHRFAQKKMR